MMPKGVLSIRFEDLPKPLKGSSSLKKPSARLFTQRPVLHVVSKRSWGHCSTVASGRSMTSATLQKHRTDIETITKPIKILRPQTRLQTVGYRKLARAARVGWQAKLHLQHASLLLMPFTFTSLQSLVESWEQVKPPRFTQPDVSAHDTHFPDREIKPPEHFWQVDPLYWAQPAHLKLPSRLEKTPEIHPGEQLKIQTAESDWMWSSHISTFNYKILQIFHEIFCSLAIWLRNTNINSTQMIINHKWS